ncbi:MAG: hypothetical protein IID41_16545, partial [Planctomycetes bacterium]|nr:hypothetical protein [Planctomycetota bacterium]
MLKTKSNKSKLQEKAWLRAKEAVRIFEDDGLTYGILFELGVRGKVNTKPDAANKSWLLYNRHDLKTVLLIPKNWVRVRQIGQQFANVTPSEVNYHRTNPCAVLKDRKGNPRVIKTEPDPLHAARYLYWVPDLWKLNDLPIVENGCVTIEGVSRRIPASSKAKYGFRPSTRARWRERCNLLPTGSLDSIEGSVRLKKGDSSRILECYL